MKKVVAALAFLVLPASLVAQTLAPIVSGSVFRFQTAERSSPSDSYTCLRPNNCTSTFVYFDLIYLGGENGFTSAFGSTTLISWRDLRPVFEFDLDGLTPPVLANLVFTVTGETDLDFDSAPATQIELGVYRSSAADADGSLNKCDFNQAGGGYDGNRYIATGCSNLAQGPLAGTVTFDEGDFPQDLTVDVSSAVDAALSGGQTRIGFVVAADQGLAIGDPNFDGDEVVISKDSPTQPRLVILGSPADITVSNVTCPGGTVGSSVDFSVLVRNTGGTTLNLTSITELSDPSAAFEIDFSATNFTLSPAQATSFRVTFSPTTEGTHSFVARIASDDPDEPTVDASVNCAATVVVAPDVEVTPPAGGCGPIPSGNTANRAILIENTGNADLNLTMTETSDPSNAFGLDPATVPSLLEPGQSASVVVNFTSPSGTATHTATYSINSDDPDEPTVAVSLTCSSGNAATATINVLSTSCDALPVGSSATAILTVQNIGGDFLAVTSVEEIGDAFDAFRVDTTDLDNVPFGDLAPGQQVDVAVYFEPSAVGSFSATIRFNSNDPTNSVFDVPINCAGASQSVSNQSVALRAGAAGDAARFVAASARAGGAEGTFWLTDLKIENAGSTDSTFDVAFLETGLNNSVAPMARMSLAPGFSAALDDLVGVGMFLRSSSVGGVMVAPSDSTSTLVVSSRTFNQATDGTFGQFIPGISPQKALRPGERHWIPGLSSGASFRANVGAVNVGGSSASVEIVLRRGSDGAQVGSPVLIDLPPWGQKQVNRIFTAAGAAAQENVYAEIRLVTGDGALAYASIVDNLSGDPTYVPATD